VTIIGLATVIGCTLIASAEDLVLLSIDSPLDGETVYSDTITVSGSATATDWLVVESVTVNGFLASGTTFWSCELALQIGWNSITAEATADTGQNNSTAITVFHPAPPTSPPPTTTPSIPPSGGSRAPSTIPSPTPTPTGSFLINTTPSGAKLYLDNSYEGITPTTLEDVTVGYHRIEVIKDGYHSETREKNLCAGKTKELNIELTPLTGSIAVFSTPSGASVYLDDEYKKKDTPCLLSEVVVGLHSIKLTKSDCFDKIIPVSVSVDKTLPLHENLTWCGSLDIFSNPLGASVFVDGNYTGETPKNISKVAVGNHSIKLTKSGYKDVATRIRVSAGNTTPVSESLPFTIRGRITNLNGVPWWAIYILVFAALVGIITAFIKIFKYILRDSH
jgi:hypothetical protein